MRTTGGILTADEVDRTLEGRPGWHRNKRGLMRELQFRDFAAARRFAELVTDAVTYYGHRPDLAIRDDGRLAISLVNHNHAGVTVADLVLADKVDGVIERHVSEGTAWDARG